MKQNLAGKIAVITGAGGGIGRVVAKRLAQEKMKLVLFGGNNLEKLDETRRLVEQQTDCLAIPGNLTDLQAMDDMFCKMIDAWGGLDILINNAGITLNTPFMETTVKQYDDIMSINVRVPYFLTQKAIPYLKQSQAATVINIASVVAHAGYPGQSAYAVSKHALLGFTKCLAAEHYKDNIRVHAIAPGGIYTDMIKIT
ncbi:MAG: SDR family oxidoreductase, partial [Lentisphaeria bacterium]|nr:SDR family oxidoreductase [Lentisphaeria bacterium]